MKPDGKAAQNKKRKKDALMSTAFDLFTKNGLSSTTISDITDKAGLGKGTFYFYFKDKYDIRNHIIARKSSQLFFKAKAALDKAVIQFGTLEDKIIFLTDNIIDQLNNDKPLLRFINKNLSWGVFANALTDKTDTGDVDFQKIFDDAIESSQIKYKDPKVMIYMIIELVSSTIYSVVLYEEPEPLDAFKQDLYPAIRAIMRGREIH